VLLQQLKRMHESGETDFGKHILPSMVKSHKLVAYDFATNTIPGTEPYEEHRLLARRGHHRRLLQAHFDTLGAQPKFRMTNRHWPIYASPDQAESAQIENGVINRSVVGSGSIVDGATLDHAMLRRSCWWNAGRRWSIASSWSARRIGRGARCGAPSSTRTTTSRRRCASASTRSRDRQRFHVTPSGIVGGARRHLPRPQERHLAVLASIDEEALPGEAVRRMEVLA
jgi:glucose-1-phosphate adenylyltransferase